MLANRRIHEGASYVEIADVHNYFSRFLYHQFGAQRVSCGTTKSIATAVVPTQQEEVSRACSEARRSQRLGRAPSTSCREVMSGGRPLASSCASSTVVVMKAWIVFGQGFRALRQASLLAAATVVLTACGAVGDTSDPRSQAPASMRFDGTVDVPHYAGVGPLPVVGYGIHNSGVALVVGEASGSPLRLTANLLALSEIPVWEFQRLTDFFSASGVGPCLAVSPTSASFTWVDYLRLFSNNEQIANLWLRQDGAPGEGAYVEFAFMVVNEASTVSGFCSSQVGPPDDYFDLSLVPGWNWVRVTKTADVVRYESQAPGSNAVWR